MINVSVVEALSQIAREKNVDRELVVQTLADALVSAAKKRYGNSDNFEAKVDPTTGSMEVFRLRAVVERVEEETLEVGLEEAREIDANAYIGGLVRESLDFNEFGRNAIQAAKQILVQRVREAERERIHREFSGRVGQIESGTVQQISHGDIILNLGRAEAAIPYKEQIRRERYRQGDTIRALIYEVLQVSRGPQVLLSRTHPELLRKLFAIEVPEIAEGIVTIHAVAREPGERAKIAVSSNDDRVDPVGACVGVKGSRVQTIVRELSGERIDIIPWIDEPSLFIARALSPATVQRVILDQRRKHAVVLVADDQLSLAIGRSGQNSRLAVQLTKWGLDIITEAQYQERRARIDATQQVFRSIAGISEIMGLSLATSGFLSVKEIAESTPELLATVPGLEQPADVARVQTAAAAYLEQHPEQPGVAAPIELAPPAPPVSVSALAPATESAPAEGEAAPAEGEAAPAEGEAAPAEGETAPAEGETAPAEGETAPAEAEMVPAEGQTVATQDEPATGEAVAATGEPASASAAAGPDEAPQQGPAAPADAMAAPAAEEAPPAADTTRSETQGGPV